MLNPDHCYQILLSRDRRFDGRIYVAVRTTGIYCRPICPVPPPKQKNVEFHPSAAAAEASGFRPCRRCRPELAPGTAAGFDTSVTVARALRLIAGGTFDEEGVSGLAARLDVGPRQLRRLFERELGASPVQIAGTQRVHFARKLLTETSLPITDIAYSAGFQSLRRFNDAFVKSFQQTPSEVRRSEKPAGRGLQLQLPFRPPYRWDDIADFLAARAIPGVEEFSGNCYRRTAVSGESAFTIEVTRQGDELYLTVTLDPPVPGAIMRVMGRLRQLFDCDANPQHIRDHFVGDAHLCGLVGSSPGLRLPGCWDGFELAVRAILGQQVSVKGASTLAGRLVAAAGVALPTPSGALTHLFPTPAALRQTDIAAIGLPRKRAETLHRLAEEVDEGRLVLDGSADPDGTLDRLRGIAGIGEWTAQYIAMRALRLPDGFPVRDLGLQKAWRAMSSDSLSNASEAWRPWRAYAAMYLWSTLHEKEGSK